MDRSVVTGPVRGVEPAARYLVELTAPIGGLANVQALADRARRAADAVTRRGTLVRFLRVVFVPEDGSCYLLYEAGSAVEVRRAVDGAGIGARSPTQALDGARSGDGSPFRGRPGQRREGRPDAPSGRGGPPPGDEMPCRGPGDESRATSACSTGIDSEPQPADHRRAPDTAPPVP